jgi:competence protein ComEC
LHRYPFLRLLIPFIVGITAGDFLFFHYQCVWLQLFSSLFICSALLLPVLYFLKKYSLRWLFGIFVCICFFSAGTALTSWRLQQISYIFPQSETLYRAVITDRPETKKQTVLYRARLLECHDSLPITFPRKNILLYFPQDSMSYSLQNGDEILFSAHLSPPSNNSKSDTFDYARYLIHKTISGIGFVKKGDWIVTTHHSHRSLRQIALKCQEKILSFYTQLGFQDDELAVLAALTVGYKEELSKEIRESYSISGASHVLALSGLHIGLLYGLLFFILKRISGNTIGIRLFRTTVILIILWGFAFITGLSPSVVRSVIMFSLFALSEFRTGKYIPMNILAAAALLMLLYNPCWAFDVGFQLSFCAVAAILLFQSRFYQMWKVDNRLLKYFWGITTVSIAAQIGVTPLILLYFSRFSVYFILTNLFVIALVSGIMYAAIVMLMASPLPVIPYFAASIVGKLIKVLNYTVRWIEQLPYASIDNVHVHPLEVFILYLIILFWLCYWQFRKAKYVISLLVCILAICCFHAIPF